MTSLETIQSVVLQIARLLDPDKVILFGSYAYGQPTPDSDVDLLVITEFTGRGFEKALEIRRMLDIPFPCDLLVKTVGDVERRYEEYDPIVRSALNQGLVLYERNRQRVA